MSAPAIPSCLAPEGRRTDRTMLCWGERDGRPVHISDVPSGLKCGCVCPGCGARLVAKKGPIKEHSFAHHNAAPCSHAYESALHKLAKDVLDERRTLLLPEVAARAGSYEHVRHKASVHDFDDAVLEDHLGEIVPDVIVRKGVHRLLVEMHVTHPCDAEKIARIERLGLSCLEIDLSGLPRDATRDQVADALVGGAPRIWIYNPKLATAQTELQAIIVDEQRRARVRAERAAAKRQAEIRAVADRLVALRQAPPSAAAPADIPEVKAVREAGFGHAIGHPLAGDFCLARPAAEWQAIVLADVVLIRMEKQADFWRGIRAKEVFDLLLGRGLLPPGVPGFMDPPTAAELEREVPGFRAPWQIVIAYLDWLVGQAILDSLNKRWSVTQAARRDWQEHRNLRASRVRTGQGYRKLIDTLVAHLPEAERHGFDAERWWHAPLADHGGAPVELFSPDRDAPYRLERQLDAIESLVRRGGPPVEMLLGLPIEPVNQRAIHVRERTRAEEARKAQAKRDEERIARRSSMQRQAREMLGDEAGPWLSSAHPDLENRSPVAAAEMSPSGHDQAWRLLTRAAAERETRLKRERWQTRLREEADRSRKPDLAHLFLKLPSADWHGQRPIELCQDEASFERLRRAVAEIVR